MYIPIFNCSEIRFPVLVQDSKSTISWLAKSKFVILMSFELKVYILIRNVFSIFYEFLSYFIVGFIVEILRMKALLVYDFEFWMILSYNFLFYSLCNYLYHRLSLFILTVMPFSFFS